MDPKTSRPGTSDAAHTAELDSAVDNPEHTQLIIRNIHGSIITREIDFCLVSCNQCTGAYVDNITGNILLIICRHQCHSVDKNGPTVPV